MAINLATEEIAGSGKGISNNPLTLIVKKNGVPDLKMVDLPGITRVPVRGQLEDIYEQISSIMMEYITPKESIILNVLSASVDFTTCESIRMSQKVDKTGERMLVVVTKADKAPEGLLEKITTDDVHIGLGYVCVRNRIGTESYAEAREEEERLFESHHSLSRIPRSMIGIPILAQKLVQIQANIISQCLPDIARKINDKLDANVSYVNKLLQNLSSVDDTMATLVHILSNAKESLRKILLRGDFEEYPDDIHMHCTARLAEMLNNYSDQLQANCVENESKDNFLMEEIRVLEEAKGIGLTNFLPRPAFLTILQRKVNFISTMPVAFVDKVWIYMEGIVLLNLMRHSNRYPQLLCSTRRSAKNLIAKKLEQSKEWVLETIAMERLANYTCNPEYDATWNKIMAQQHAVMEILKDPKKNPNVTLDGYGNVDIGHLRNHLGDIQQAFDMKMRMTAYWKIVLRRLVDAMALHLLHSIHNLVNGELEKEIVVELMSPHGAGIERILEESPALSDKRIRLKRSIKLLKESKDLVSNIMDKVASYGD
ncbi:membrane traffic protein [Lithospermum erythrorhizon]|uniref:Membrane traffic protein n=1 Tax=Lithospermum erythrorhizon TaxID=34254 RepID=A0AAV3QCB2_LITER